MRGSAYQAGSDDDEEDEEGHAGSGAVGSETPREGGKALNARGTLTTSQSTVLTPRNAAARKVGTLSTASMLGQVPAAEEVPESGSVSDAMINARLKNARQKIQQREGGDDPWGNGGDKGDEEEEDSGGEEAETARNSTRAAADEDEGEGGERSAEPPTSRRIEFSPAELAAMQMQHALALDADQVGWLTRPVPEGNMVKCYIKRDKSGFDMLYPQYRCYLQTPEGDRFVMAARKRKKSNSNNYGSVNYRDKDNRGVRKELAVMLNTQNVVGAPSPRKVRGILPQLVEGKPMEYKPMTEADTVLMRDKEGRLEKDFLLMLSKQPNYNNSTGKYSLNFNGRVRMASVKNVQMVYAGQDEVLFQFGKTGKNDFILDFQHPFTPMQAFAFGLTSLAYKLANEGG
ncbi:tubby C-terminal-like domain-containing protein [Pavlovales sp. CCMP2436]|nr:tubby C-terminal-like domain-containing protein [Pavlovales sp. CCMP2436]